MTTKFCKDCGNKVSRGSQGYCRKCYVNHYPSGKNHGNWKGGTHINKWGYLRYNPTHKFGGKFVHVVVLEKKLGRHLRKNERTHHINGNKLDNSPENLEALIIGKHDAIHKPWLHRKTIRDPKTGRFIG